MIKDNIPRNCFSCFSWIMFRTLKTVQYRAVCITDRPKLFTSYDKEGSRSVQQVYRVGFSLHLENQFVAQAQLFTFTFVIAALLILLPFSGGATTEEKRSSDLFPIWSIFSVDQSC